ncbi:DELLA protein GAI1-like [Trifolium medium]|uniref:DELLA protein GAI1-like n=1 Tax=Trifolium medium TaxID=97028 RepID=A0A392MLP4_9FABA|nr:DELLA protein GAI1-like [Trifolium medium]
MLQQTLMAYAEAVEQNNLPLAEEIAKPIKYLAALQNSATSKVATYLAEALAQRIHGIQWQKLMRELALRPGGPHAFRLTGVGPPASDNSNHLHQAGWKLTQLAQRIGVEFEYRRVVVDSLADLEASMLELRSSETVAVNSVFELHKLNARPGALERVFSVIRQIQPEIVTIVEQEANHNGPSFLDRFTESLYYYLALFDSLESSLAEPQDNAMSEVLVDGR